MFKHLEGLDWVNTVIAAFERCPCCEKVEFILLEELDPRTGKNSLRQCAAIISSKMMGYALLRHYHQRAPQRLDYNTYLRYAATLANTKLPRRIPELIRVRLETAHETLLAALIGLLHPGSIWSAKLRVPKTFDP